MGQRFNSVQDCYDKKISSRLEEVLGSVMNELEKKAYIEMLVMFVENFRGDNNEDPSQLEGYMYHDYMSIFENFCSILESNGLAKGVWPSNWLNGPDDPRPGKMQPPAYILTLSYEESRDFLNNGIPKTAESFQHVLINWIQFFQDFPPSGIKALQKGSKQPQIIPYYEKVIHLLGGLGYCEIIGDEFSWTEEVDALELHYYSSSSAIHIVDKHFDKIH